MEAVERKRERAKELYRLNREQKLKYVHEYRKKNAIKPVGIGGEHKKSNIRVICRRCNLTRPKDGTDCK